MTTLQLLTWLAANDGELALSPSGKRVTIRLRSWKKHTPVDGGCLSELVSIASVEGIEGVVEAMVEKMGGWQ